MKHTHDRAGLEDIAKQFIDSLDVRDLDDSLTVKRLVDTFEEIYKDGYAHGAFDEIMNG